MVKTYVFIDGVFYGFKSNTINPKTLLINLPLLKEEIERQLGLPKQNQRITHGGKEIVDVYRHPCTDGVLKQGSYLVVDHQESTASPYHLNKEFIRKQWPSMKEEELNRLFIEFNDLSKGVVDRLSLTEHEDEDAINKSKELSSQVVMAQLFFSSSGETIVESGDCLTLQGQEFYLYELLKDGSGVTMTTKMYWQYRRSTQEEYQQVKEFNQKREEDIRHCEKLLHDLPIALANSEKALAAVDEKSNDVDVNELGAMVIEQKTIRREIETQEQKLSTLRSQPPACLNLTPLPNFNVWPTLTLEWGMNRLPAGDIIQLVRVNDIHQAIPRLSVRPLCQ